ncbi:MAG: DUF2971 domain-containing protein [Treponema sp.]|nr:DUF2971 domain-containing protein [Treponema sp.]
MNNNEEMTVPKKLYHYTSKEGFLGIIENKTLWASEILYMNDEKETVIPFEIYEKLLEEDKNTNVRKEYFNFFKEFRGLETYVISFSEKKDDLNMWRAYGDNASGICIEFNSDSLLKVLKENQEKMELRFEKCIYDEQEQKNAIQSLLDSKNGSKNLEADGLYKKLLKFSPYFKDKSFRDEKEWRIIVKLDTGLENRKLKKVRFRKDIFVPYCELQIEKEKIPREKVEGKYPWLGDITVGHNTTDIFYDSVLHACSVYGIGFGKPLERNLLKSVSPYRG